MIKLEIVVPDGLVFSGEVDEVTLPGAGGYLGILPQHAPLLSELRVGILSYRVGEDLTELFCRSGFAEVLADKVTVLAEAAESADQVDADQARQDKDQAQRVLAANDPDTDYDETMLLLEQAEARLQLLEPSTHG